MKTVLELLTMFSVYSFEELLNDDQLSRDCKRLYEITPESISDWMSFVDVLTGDLDPDGIIPIVDAQTLRLGWLQKLSSGQFAAGGGVFASAVRFDRVLFRKFLTKLMDSKDCYILPIFEALVYAIQKTQDMRATQDSIAIILGLTRKAGDALKCINSQSFLEYFTFEFSTQDKQKIWEAIKNRQLSNFDIGLRASTSFLREIAAGDTGRCDSYWQKTSELV